MIHLPSVTLIIVDCVDFARAKLSYEHCCKYVTFGDAKILTHFERDEPYVEKISQIHTIQDYSLFMIRHLNQYFTTEYVLVAQWDGFVWYPELWQDEFLYYDYIGAPWPASLVQSHLSKEFCVGNGGFSLRSKRIQDFVSKDKDLILYRENKSPKIWHPFVYPEDVVICQLNREYLEQKGFKFAPEDLANDFAWENGPERKSFGVHSRISLKQHIVGLELKNL